MREWRLSSVNGYLLALAFCCSNHNIHELLTTHAFTNRQQFTSEKRMHGITSTCSIWKTPGSASTSASTRTLISTSTSRSLKSRRLHAKRPSGHSQHKSQYGMTVGDGETKVKPFGTYSAKFIDDNGLTITTDEEGLLTARPLEEATRTNEKVVETTASVKEEKNETGIMEVSDTTSTKKNMKPRKDMQEHPAKVVPQSGFNVVLTHCTADFDSLASAVGLAKLWSIQDYNEDGDNASTVGRSNRDSTTASYNEGKNMVDKQFDSSSHLPTFVVLPRGAHPSVQRFLALHKHLFPIRSLKSLPSDLSGLNRLALVDAQRRDRIGPAEHLLDYANRITVVDHHLDTDSDIPEATDYVLDKVGSVSTLIVERLMKASLGDDGLTEAEATLLALGIHADTGSLCYDSTTARDATALAWVMQQGASQTAIAEHAQSSLSREQQGVLTQALINTNSTVVHGVTVSTVLLTADGFINGLAAVTQDALELSSSDVFLLGLVYEPRSGGKGGKNKPGERVTTRLLEDDNSNVLETSGWKGSEEQLLRQRLSASFARKDLDNSGYLDKRELSAALASSGIIASEQSLDNLMNAMDMDGNGLIDFEEFVTFAKDAQTIQSTSSKKSTLIIIGRAKAGVNLKSVKLNRLLEEFGGGGHAKAASATVRLNDESEAAGILSGLVDDLVDNCLQEQPTVGDFMTSPVLSVRPDMNEKQVEDLFTRYDVRSLPVVDENNDVIGLVTYKEVAAAKQRMWNKEQKRLRQEAEALATGGRKSNSDNSKKHDDNEAKRDVTPEQRKLSAERRKRGSTVKAWMKQHVTMVEASRTMAEVEAILLETDVGSIPVVEDGTTQLVGMVTRTDLLRQHRYYPSLHYHNKGMSDSIEARKPIIALRRKLKKFDLDE